MYAEREVLAGIDAMRGKLEHLETKVDEMHSILQRMLLLVPPAIIIMPDGSKRLFRPNRPVSVQTLQTMARVEELARARRHLPAKERTETFLQSIEQARAEAIGKGTAIDDEREAAIGD